MSLLLRFSNIVISIEFCRRKTASFWTSCAKKRTKTLEQTVHSRKLIRNLKYVLLTPNSQSMIKTLQPWKDVIHSRLFVGKSLSFMVHSLVILSLSKTRQRKEILQPKFTELTHNWKYSSASKKFVYFPTLHKKHQHDLIPTIENLHFGFISIHE